MVLANSNSGLLSNQVSARMLRSQSAAEALELQQERTMALVHSRSGLLSHQVSAGMLRSQSSAKALGFIPAAPCRGTSQQWLGLETPPLSVSDGEDSQADSQTDCESGLSHTLEVSSLLTTKALDAVKKGLSHMLPPLQLGTRVVPGSVDNILQQGLLGEGSFKKVGDEAWESTEASKSSLMEGCLAESEERMSECSQRSESTSASGKWWGGQAFLLKSGASLPEVAAASSQTPRVLQREGRLAMKKHSNYRNPAKYNIFTPHVSARN